MDMLKIPKTDALDIIFDQRNKLYGAYELRKNYHKRAKKAFMITATLALLGTALPLLATFLNKDVITMPPVGPVIITPIDPPDIPEEEIIAPLPPQETIDEPVVENPIPIIIEAEKVQEEELPPTKEELKDHHSGFEDHEGENGTESLDITIPNPGEDKPGTPVIVEEIPTDKVVSTVDVEQLPEFPGGDEALSEFLKQHLNYPKEAVDAEKDGRVVVEFVVNKNGQIDEIKVVKGVGYGMDQEAARVVNQMPAWKPGKMNGHAVNVLFHLPVLFEIR